METDRKSTFPSINTVSLAAQICSGMVAGVGAIGLLGWISNFQLLASIHPDYIPMAPNTAVAFVVLGITLFALVRWPMNLISRWIAKVAAIFVVLLSLLALTKYLINIDFGIDQLLVITTKTLGGVPVGFMSPLTAANFLLSGFSVSLLLSSSVNRRYMKSIASCLAIVIALIGSVVILGYLYRTPLLYGGTIVPMALTTAVTFVFLGIGLISATGLWCWPQCLVMGSSTRARLLRAFLPVTVVIVIIMGWLYTLIALHSRSNPALLSSLLAILFMVIVSIIISHMANLIGRSIDLAETKRKLAEVQLRKLSQAIEQSPSTVVITNTKGSIEYVNPKFTQLTGYTAVEAIGQNLSFLKSDKTSPEEHKRLWDVITSGGEWREEFCNKKKNGEHYWERASISPIRNSEGVITHFLLVREDITERMQAVRRLNTEHAVTHILAESSMLNEASQKFLQAICECLEWDLGEIWMIDRKVGVLRCEEIWHIPSLEAKEFTTVTKQITFSPGVGLPGRVWSSAKPAWIANVVHDANFLRAPVALKAGLHATFGFPILIGNDVIGIIEFFSHEIREPDEPLLNMMSAIGSQIGQFIKRKEVESQIIKLSMAVEQSPNTIVITDNKGNIEYVNPKGAQLTGYTPEEVVGKNTRIFKSGETPSEEYKQLWTTIKSGGEWRGEFHNKKKTGELYWEYAAISPIKDSQGVITHFIAIKEDITERKRFEAHLNHLANNDPLTNLFNRRRFREELENWIAQMERHDSSGALLFLDMDNFKYVNDTLGHQKGDEILINFAYLLRARVRETDIIARLGGDEFAIILPYTDAAQAQSIAMQILELARGNTHAGNDNVKFHGITVSIGIALFPDHGNDVEKLLTYADLAMYEAKEKGRNCVCMYSSDQKIHCESRLDWEERVRDALKNNRFVLHLQPISNVRHKKIMGYEALLRMVDENDALISPSEFLNIAERFGLIRDIDRWVVRRAIHLIAEQQFADRGLFLEVNLSGRAFNDPELLPLIKQEFAATNINPATLVFEITETATIENIVDAQHFIVALKSMGCRFGLDDFGIGFSSFSYLKQLPVDFLKIDGSFISELKHNHTDQHLVRAMVEVARGLGKQTIAEFVGCEETVQLLSKYGVDYAQGYHIGKPIAVSEIDTYSEIS